MFTDQPLPEEVLRDILTAATLAPSGKNGQPWRFVIVSDEKHRVEMAGAMRKGIAERKADGLMTGSAEHTAEVMEQAPVTIFVFNPGGISPLVHHSIEQTVMETVDTQSIGAAIENMILAAQDLGVGSLWICDIFSAYRQLCTWLGEQGQLVAAVALGYPAEQPPARPRRPLADVVRWVGEP